VLFVTCIICGVYAFFCEFYNALKELWQGGQ